MDPASAPLGGHLDDTYRWIPILSGFVAFAWAMSVGAVDVPISFGPAVVSGALTLPQAVLIAAVLEITGACLLSNRDADTLLAHIMRKSPPGTDDALLMWGLFIALIVATVWLAAAVYWEVPASSSLVISGAVIGVLLSVQGVTSVYWISPSGTEERSSLRVGGVLGIVLAWVVAPSLAGAMSFSLYGATKLLLLRAHQSVQRTLRAMPLYYGVTVMVVIYFVIYRGCPRQGWGEFDSRRASLIAGSSGGLAACLAYLIVVPLAQKRFQYARRELTPADAQNHVIAEEQQQVEEGKLGAASPAQPEVTAEDLIQQFNERRVLPTVYEADEEEQQSADFSFQSSKVKSSPANPAPPARLSFGQLLAHTPNRLLSFQRLRTKPPLGPRQRVLQSMENFKRATFNRRFVYDRQTLVRHALAEKFDAKAEELFSFLQIMTACAAAFAHGANEVAWAMGPFAAILEIYEHSRRDQAGGGQVQVWVLALGGAGVSLGFALWGWRIIRSVGGRLIFISPARGFSAQLSALAAVLMAYKVNLPLSTTHILIGAAVGVGLSDGPKHVNWTLLATYVMAWAGLLLLACGTSAAFYSFTVYSPSYTGG